LWTNRGQDPGPLFHPKNEGPAPFLLNLPPPATTVKSRLDPSLVKNQGLTPDFPDNQQDNGVFFGSQPEKADKANKPPHRKQRGIPLLSFRKARRAYPESSLAAGRWASLIEQETSVL
jgi:hypothetical protein